MHTNLFITELVYLLFVTDADFMLQMWLDSAKHLKTFHDIESK